MCVHTMHFAKPTESTLGVDARKVLILISLILDLRLYNVDTLEHPFGLKPDSSRPLGNPAQQIPCQSKALPRDEFRSNPRIP